MASPIPQLRTPAVIATGLDALLRRGFYVLRKRSHLVKPFGPLWPSRFQFPKNMIQP